MFQNLNRRYYVLYTELCQNKDVLSERQYKAIQNVLFDQYERELELILGEHTLEFATMRFELRYKLRHYVPRFLNRVSRKLKKDLKKRFIEYVENLTLADDLPSDEEEEPCEVTDLALYEEDPHE